MRSNTPQRVRQAILSCQSERVVAFSRAGGKATTRTNKKRADEKEIRDAIEQELALREHELLPQVARRDDLVEDL